MKPVPRTFAAYSNFGLKFRSQEVLSGLYKISLDLSGQMLALIRPLGFPPLLPPQAARHCYSPPPNLTLPCTHSTLHIIMADLYYQKKKQCGSGAHPASYSVDPMVLSCGQRPGVKLTSHLLLVPRFRISGAIPLPPPPIYDFRAFEVTSPAITPCINIVPIAFITLGLTKIAMCGLPSQQCTRILFVVSSR